MECSYDLATEARGWGGRAADRQSRGKLRQPTTNGGWEMVKVDEGAPAFPRAASDDDPMRTPQRGMFLAGLVRWASPDGPRDRPGQSC